MIELLSHQGGFKPKSSVLQQGSWGASSLPCGIRLLGHQGSFEKDKVWNEKMKWHLDMKDAVRSARKESGASLEFQLESPATAERIRHVFFSNIDYNHNSWSVFTEWSWSLIISFQGLPAKTNWCKKLQNYQRREPTDPGAYKFELKLIWYDIWDIPLTFCQYWLNDS